MKVIEDNEGELELEVFTKSNKVPEE